MNDIKLISILANFVYLNIKKRDSYYI